MTHQTIRIDRRYELLGQIGRGGMGIVYKALDRLTGAEVALKQVGRAGQSDDENGRAALMHEFRIAATLRHTHVISVLDYGISDGAAPVPRQPYYTMRLLEQPLTITEFDPNGTVPMRVGLLAQMLSALGYLHRRGVIHRDLKPSNVLVEPNGIVQVVDFGLSSLLGTVSSDGAGGTVAYMAPELLDDGVPGVVTDLYAVGVIAYELFAGRHPFDGKTLSKLLYQVTQTTPDWSPLYAYEPLGKGAPPLHSVIARMMHHDPAQRYPDAWTAIEALCDATALPIPVEDDSTRDSFLQAARFVGREDELDSLRTAMRAALVRRTPAVWLVGGVSGVGKSRLLEELRIDALVSGWRVLRGQSSAELRLPYQLWRAPVRELILGETLTPAQTAALRPLLPDLEPGDSLSDSQSAGYVSRLVATLVEMLQSEGTPILLILEDLHWAGNGLDLLFRMMPMLTHGALLVVGSYRDDECPELPTLGAFDGIVSLNRFQAAQIAALSASMLGTAGQDAALIALVERETDGNAFFMVEVIRALAEEAGALRRIGQIPLPERIFAGGVRDAVMRRLNRLPAWAAPLLRAAAVAGRALDLGVLGALAHSSIDVDAWLTAGVNVGVLEFTDEQWRFSHDQLRDLLITAIDADERRALHQRIADAIAQVHPDDARYAEVSFEHLLSAGDSARAIPHAQRAARAALVMGRYDAVRRIGEAALNLLPSSDVQTALLLTIAEAALYQSDYRETERITRTLAETLASDDAGRPSALLLLARSLLLRGDYPEARALFSEVLERAKGVAEEHWIAAARYGLGQIAEKQGDGTAASAHYSDALDRYRALSDDAGIADSLHGLGGVAFNVGDYDRALAAFEESLALRRAIGDPRAIASSLNNIGGALSAQGSTDRSIVFFNESLQMRRMVGEARGIAMSLLNLGHVLEEAGDLESAFAHFSESYDRFRAIGGKQGIVIALNNLASNWRKRAEPGRAAVLYDETLMLARSLDDRLMIAHALNGLAGAQMALGSHETALRLLDEEILLRRELGGADFLALALQMRADALQALEGESKSDSAEL